MPIYEIPDSLLSTSPPPDLPPRTMNDYSDFSGGSDKTDKTDNKYEFLLDSESIPKPRKFKCISPVLIAIFLTVCICLVVFWCWPLFSVYGGSDKESDKVVDEEDLHEASEHCSPGYTWLNVTGFCYKATVTPHSIFDATRTCKSESAYLASIHSEAENEFVLSLYFDTLTNHRKNMDRAHDRTDIWLGLSLVKGEWKWSDGSAVDYTNWAKDEPNNLETEKWATILTKKIDVYNPHGAQWNNLPSFVRAFVCKKPSH